MTLKLWTEFDLRSVDNVGTVYKAAENPFVQTCPYVFDVLFLLHMSTCMFIYMANVKLI